MLVESWVWIHSMRILSNHNRDRQIQVGDRHIHGSSRGVVNVGWCCRFG